MVSDEKGANIDTLGALANWWLLIILQENDALSVLVNNFSMTWYPLGSIKHIVHHTAVIQSWNPTISDSVELQVFSFFLVKFTMENPLPTESSSPVCPRMLGCTSWDTWIHQFWTSLTLALRIKGRYFVPLCTSLDELACSSRLFWVLKLLLWGSLPLQLRIVPWIYFLFWCHVIEWIVRFLCDMVQQHLVLLCYSDSWPNIKVGV